MANITPPQPVRVGIYLVASAALSWVLVFGVMGVPRTVDRGNPVANETVTVWTPPLEVVVPVLAMILVGGLYAGWRSARDSE